MTPRHEALLQHLIAESAAGRLSGIYGDIPEEVYNDPRCPGVRSGHIKEIVSRSFSHLKAGSSKKTAALAFGTAFHQYILEPEKFDRTKVTANEYLDMMQMRKKLLQHPDAKKVMDGAKREVTCFSICKETGLLKRCRIDLLKSGEVIADIKTCQDASESAFIYDSRKYHYRVSAAFYVGIWFDLTGQYLPFEFIASEKQDPYEAAVYRLSARSLSMGELDVGCALRTLKNIAEKGSQAWSGYPLGVKEISI